jgi:hypothetical protein
MPWTRSEQAQCPMSRDLCDGLRAGARLARSVVTGDSGVRSSIPRDTPAASTVTGLEGELPVRPDGCLADNGGARSTRFEPTLSQASAGWAPAGVRLGRRSVQTE